MRNKVFIITLIVLAASLAGLVLSSLLIFEYFGVAPSIAEAVCTRATNGINACMVVSASRFSAVRGIPLIGDVPVAVLGFIFYGFVAGIILLQLMRKHIDKLPLYTLLIVITGIAFLGDIILFLISFYVIKLLCPFCVMTYAATFIILFLSVILLKLDLHKTELSKLTRIKYYFKINLTLFLIVLFTLLAAGMGMGAGARIIAKSKDSATYKDRHDNAIRQYETAKPVTIEINNAPSIGKNNASAHFIVFFDFTCNHCWKEILVLEKLIEKYNEKMRVSFKSISLNSDCAKLNDGRDKEESDACVASAAALCANTQGKFLPYAKLLFKNYHEKGIGFTEKSVFDSAKSIRLNTQEFKQCFLSKRIQEQLALERLESDKLGVLTTPTVYLNGRLLTGKSRKPDMIEALVQYCIQRNQ